MSDFATTIASEADQPRLVVIGDVDLVSADALVRVAQEALSAHDSADFELDLSGVTFIDSTGVGALIRIRNDALGRGGTLQLVGASHYVVRTLALTGLSETFGVDGDGAP